MKTHRIVYLSRATMPLSAEKVASLVERAVARNVRNGITGLLLFDGRRFLQAIEGPVDEVRGLMNHIRLDDRHRSVQIVADTAIVRREFGNWSMAYQQVSQADRHSPLFLHQVKSRMDPVPDIGLQAAFIGFARLACDPQREPAA